MAYMVWYMSPTIRSIEVFGACSCLSEWGTIPSLSRTFYLGYVYILGPKVFIIYILGALGFEP